MTNKISSTALSLERRDYFITESDFYNKLYEDIEVIINQMEMTSDKYFCDDEDKLSHTIVTSLIHLGYRASEQTKKNGSVDITVSTKDDKFMWIAEAKIGYGYQKIFEGLLQLVTRYVKRDREAGLIIYYQKAESNVLFNNWLKYLYSHNWDEYCTKQDNLTEVTALLGGLKLSELSPVNGSSCYSDVNVIKPSGDGMNVRCFYVDVYHQPLDKSGVKNKSLKEGLARNKIKDIYKLWQTGEFNESHYVELFGSLEIYFDGAMDD